MDHLSDLHVGIPVVVTGVLCNRAQERMRQSLYWHGFNRQRSTKFEKASKRITCVHCSLSSQSVIYNWTKTRESGICSFWRRLQVRARKARERTKELIPKPNGSSVKDALNPISFMCEWNSRHLKTFVCLTLGSCSLDKTLEWLV